MNTDDIILELDQNRSIFEGHLRSASQAFVRWRPEADKWCLLEILCHLIDEEREDFRARVFHCINHPGTMPPPIDPPAWVTERRYKDQDYSEKVDEWLDERSKSISLLKKVKDSEWSASFDHAHFGTMTARLFLANWLAHDYFHLRQIVRLKREFLLQHGGEPLEYAGGW